MGLRAVLEGEAGRSPMSAICGRIRVFRRKEAGYETGDWKRNLETGKHGDLDTGDLKCVGLRHSLHLPTAQPAAQHRSHCQQGPIAQQDV